MHKHGSSAKAMSRNNSPMEGQHGRGIVRHTVVGPGFEVKLVELVRKITSLHLKYMQEIQVIKLSL